MKKKDGKRMKKTSAPDDRFVTGSNFIEENTGSAVKMNLDGMSFCSPDKGAD